MKVKIEELILLKIKVAFETWFYAEFLYLCALSKPIIVLLINLNLKVYMFNFRRLLSLIIVAFFVSVYSQSAELTHVKGVHAVGVRGGIGTKSDYDVGLTYSYYFNSKTALLLEADYERAKFGMSDFSGVVLVSPGVVYSVWNPAVWFYMNLSVGASVGYDNWRCDIVDEEVSGMVYGANVGYSLEFFPSSRISCLLKAQQYMLFGNDDQYLKPLFSVGVRYNFHK